MSVDPRHYHYHQRRRHLKDFERKAKSLLSESDRKYLYGVLKDYQTHRQVDHLVNSLQVALDTPSKMSLFLEIRHFLPAGHQQRYDRLVPYHKMAVQTDADSFHPLAPASQVGGLEPGGDVSLTYGSLGRLYVARRANDVTDHSLNGTMSLGRRPRGGLSSYSTSPQFVRQNPAGRTIVTGSAEVEERGPVKTLLLLRDVDDNLGFSVRGGSEHGLGIYVSEITDGSAADLAGLHPGDHILEVNSIRFENIASSSAVKVLTGTTRLRITVKRVGKIPGFKFAREKTSWYDTDEGRMVEGSLEDHGTFHYPTGLAFVDGVIERRVHLSLNKEGQYLGFNIRGGSEYGLGIYVSKVDSGGLAEQKGLKVGDQITAVNGQNLEDLSHSAAVDILRSHKMLVLTVRDVGKFPAFKEIYAEYSWIDTTTGSVTRSRRGTYFRDKRPRIDISSPTVRSGLITSVPVTASPMDQNNGDRYIQYSQDCDVTDSFSDIRENHRRSNDDDDESLEEQVREMTFPDDACLTVRLSSDSPSTSDDRESDVIRQLDTMLLPHSDDVILQERPPEVKKEDIVKTKAKEKGKKKDKDNPRSQLGVFALQLENMPEEMKKLSKSHRDRIQSLRKPGEINPRQFEDIELNVKKTRTFREMLFGTKSRAKMKGPAGIKSRNKSRQPLSNLGFAETTADTRRSAGSLDLNLEETAPTTTFVRGLGSQMMLQDSVSQMNTTQRVSERARELLTEDEVLAVTRHLTRYEAHGDIEALVTPLLAIFDSPEKMALLGDVRGIIKPTDIGRFDSMVSNSEFDAYEELAAETGTTALMEQREQNLVPPKKTLMASVPDSRGNFKLKKHDEYKAKQEKLDQVEREHRERLARLAREKRQSLTDMETPFPHLPFAEHNLTDVPNANSVPSRNILDVLKPKGNSKVYKAVKSSVVNVKNTKVRQDKSTSSMGGREEHGSMELIYDEPKENGVANNAAEILHTHLGIHTSSPQSSRRSSVSSSGINGIYSVSDRNHSDRLPVSHPDLYSVSSIEAASEFNSSMESESCKVTRVSKYRTAEQSQSENVVLLISKTERQDGNHHTQEESLLQALEVLDDLEGDEEGSSSAQISPRSVTSTSTTTSTRYGSYDVHSDSECAVSERTPPVFIPPPPPSEPPPASQQQEEEEEEGEGEGWDEWVTEDVTQEVIAATSVGLAASTGGAVMRDQSVGQTPRDSPRGSTTSTRGSVCSEASREENIFNSNINNTNSITLDYFGGVQDAIPSTGDEDVSRADVTDTASRSSSLHRGAVQPLIGDSDTKQVNSLRDTLRARRKSTDRPRLSADAFVFPEHLLVPNWGRVEQADSHQEEVVLNHQTVEDSRPPPGPSRSDEHSTEEAEEDAYNVSGVSNKAAHIQGELLSTMTSLNHNHQDIQSEYQLGNTAANMGRMVSGTEVETFMTEAECRGDLYLQQQQRQQALDSVVYAEPGEAQEVTVEEPSLIILSKTTSSLGMSISGGRNSRSQPQVKIQKILPGGAAAEVGILKAGMRLISVDGYSLANVTHPQAVQLIRRAYANKKQPEMELLVLP